MKRVRTVVVEVALVALALLSTLGVSEFLFSRNDGFVVPRPEGSRTYDPAMRFGVAAGSQPNFAFRWGPDGNGPLHIRSSDPVLLYEMRPSTRLNDVIATNAAGFRDREFAMPKPSGVRRIVVIGDEITFAHDLRPEQSYPKIIEVMLNGRPELTAGVRFEVLNMGVTGYNAEQEGELVKTKALALQPDMLLVQFNVDDNTIGDVDGIFQHFFLSSPLHTWDYIRLQIRQWRPERSAYALLEPFYAELARIHRGGLPVLVALFPPRFDQFSSIQRQRELCERLGLPYVDMTAAFQAAGLERAVATSNCPNALGHRLAAVAIHRSMRAMGGPLFTDLKQTPEPAAGVESTHSK
ncbi:MAG: SGNH/GDSL hydrolase family protein [Candidatus Hydrogenedentes bacterium]|nr:SGNH/GDSL hydrolase family protein [Candidatus Hydrogenedentota bacterium]